MTSNQPDDPTLSTLTPLPPEVDVSDLGGPRGKRNEKDQSPQQTTEKIQKSVEQNDEGEKRARRRKRNLRKQLPIVIGILLIFGLSFTWALFAVAIPAGIRLVDLSEQPYDPQNLKASDASQGSLLLTLSPLAVSFSTAGIVMALHSWRKRFKYSARRKERDLRRKQRENQNETQS